MLIPLAATARLKSLRCPCRSTSTLRGGYRQIRFRVSLIRQRAGERLVASALLSDNRGERESDQHEPVCCRSQFFKGMKFMFLTTTHYLNNMWMEIARTLRHFIRFL
jgi:hypothetical protein